MCFHPMGEAVFWLKSLYQLGFVRFFDFYFWIREVLFCVFHQLCWSFVGCPIGNRALMTTKVK
ncbi:hypothetical protein [uncultured Gammaproteobacteria bacterium]|nr:hypothetical protein [uncultured Gammaproteobacteria bacterium]